MSGPPNCGCVYRTDDRTGATVRLEWCDRHSSAYRLPENLDSAYYAELGSTTGEPPHLAELAEALGPFPPANASQSLAVEIGCGASHYVPGLRAAGYAYLGVEPSPWAAEWTRRQYGAVVIESDVESLALNPSAAGLVLAAHSIEHTPTPRTRLSGVPGFWHPAANSGSCSRTTATLPTRTTSGSSPPRAFAGRWN